METLEVIIGIVFIFLLLSLFGTIIQEFVSTAFSLRGKVLLDGLIRLLEFDEDDKTTVKEARKAIRNTKSYNKLKERYFFKQIDLLPSYISSMQLIAILKEAIQHTNYKGKKNILNFNALKDQIYDVGLLNSLNQLATGKDNTAIHSSEDYKQEIITRFDDLMGRASGWYKRRTQALLLLIGFGIAIAVNADTFKIYKNLTNNSEDRKALLALAEDFIEHQDERAIAVIRDTGDMLTVDSTLLRETTEMRHLVDSLIKSGIHKADSPLGLGWDHPTCNHNGEKENEGHIICYLLWILGKIPGWLITALAISLGAPFWFDLLNKLVNVRIAGKRFEKVDRNEAVSQGREASPPDTSNNKANVVAMHDSVSPEERTTNAIDERIRDTRNEDSNLSAGSNSENLTPEIALPQVHLSVNRPHVTRRNKFSQAHALGEAGLPFMDIDADPLARKTALIDIVKWLDVDNPLHLRYKKRNADTYCNIYAHDYCFLGQAYLPRVWWKENAIKEFRRRNNPTPSWGQNINELNANALFDWLVEHGKSFGWRRLTTGQSHSDLLDEIQESANQGHVCIISAKRHILSKPGHICAVVPEHGNEHAIRKNGQVIHPLQSQAGGVNHKYFTKTSPQATTNWWEKKGVSGFSDFGFWVHS